MAQISQISSKTKHFSPRSGSSDVPTPWEAAFPGREPLGYWELFEKRCAKILGDRGTEVIDEETARTVWISILKDYEEYERMGMWLPEQHLGEHRLVATALGWY